MDRTTHHFHAPDGVRLGYHVQGSGEPLVCVPGGPMLDATYLGDLGGLDAHRRLVLLDNRGSGSSDRPADPASYRCDHLVGDLEALRLDLDLDRMDLLAHSGGANVAYRYCERYADRIARLILVTPSTRALGIAAPGEVRREMVRLREGAPWYDEAAAAFERIDAGTANDKDWEAIAPFTHGTWDEAAKSFDADMDARRNEDAAVAFGDEGAFEPPTTQAALAALPVPVLVVAGGHDIAGPPRILAEVAALFPDARLVVQPGAGHFPWRDDADGFASTVSDFLSVAD